jgi:hypothetical protein
MGEKRGVNTYRPCDSDPGLAWSSEESNLPLTFHSDSPRLPFNLRLEGRLLSSID